MPTRKEELALRWAEKSEEEKNIVRKKTAARVKLYRARKGVKKRAEMKTAELSRVRATDKHCKRRKRKEMTEEQRELVKAKDRERKAKGRKKLAEKKKENISNEIKVKRIDADKLEKKKMKQMASNCKTQQKLAAQKTEEENEEILGEMAERMREKRLKMSTASKKLARIHAKEGMSEHRRYGYLREYKQRKRRAPYNPWTWEKEPHAISEYFKKVKEIETDQERKEYLKKINRMRVEKHRKKVKKMLQEPVIIESYGEKGEYEQLRERNIKELERLKKESGLFD